MEQAWAALAAAGPTALVLGIAVATLWSTNKALHIQYEGDPTDKDKPGKLATLAAASQKREDDLRTFYENKLKAERDEQKAILAELNATLRGAFTE